jgi:hypothetical protein
LQPDYFESRDFLAALKSDGEGAMLKMAAFTVVIGVTAAGTAFADQLTIDNGFQWPTDMRFDPLKLAPPWLPPPSLGDQMVHTYQNMPLRPTYMPASDANGHGAFSLQFRRAF